MPTAIDVAGTLCGRCLNLDEPPWYPNNRQRAVLYFEYVLTKSSNLYSRVLRLHAEELAALLADPTVP